MGASSRSSRETHSSCFGRGTQPEEPPPKQLGKARALPCPLRAAHALLAPELCRAASRVDGPHRVGRCLACACAAGACQWGWRLAKTHPLFAASRTPTRCLLRSALTQLGCVSAPVGRGDEEDDPEVEDEVRAERGQRGNKVPPCALQAPPGCNRHNASTL